MSRSPFPDPDVARGWHQLLLAGDPVTPNVVCSAYLEPLAEYLRQKYSSDEDSIGEAVGSALTEYVKRPQLFDPARNADLGVYLRMAAVGDLLNLHQKESKHHRARITVELDSLAGNETRGDGPVLRLIRDEETEAFEEYVARIDLSKRDQAIIRLVLAGEKETILYAAALDIADWPIEAQKAEVKRAKDRVKKRLRGFKYHA